MSYFEQHSLRDLYAAIEDAYLSDDRPWVVGFSGGKDSTATLQAVWWAVRGLEPGLESWRFGLTNSAVIGIPVAAATSFICRRSSCNFSAMRGSLFSSSWQNVIHERIPDCNLITRAELAERRFGRWNLIAKCGRKGCIEEALGVSDATGNLQVLPVSVGGNPVSRPTPRPEADTGGQAKCEA